MRWELTPAQAELYARVVIPRLLPLALSNPQVDVIEKSHRLWSLDFGVPPPVRTFVQLPRWQYVEGSLLRAEHPEQVAVKLGFPQANIGATSDDYHLAGICVLGPLVHNLDDFARMHGCIPLVSPNDTFTTNLLKAFEESFHLEPGRIHNFPVWYVRNP